MNLSEELEKKGVLKSNHIIRAFRRIDRADFVPKELRSEAYEDTPLPIGHGQTISQPYTVAFMLEMLQPRLGDIVMDVGFGSGWQTALLAEIVGEEGKVYAVEIVPELYAEGKTNIDKYSFITSGRVDASCKDARPGLLDAARRHGGFDKIIAAATSREVPEVWLAELKVGGRLVVPIQNSLWLYTKTSDTTYEKEEYPGFMFVPLVHGKKSWFMFSKTVVSVLVVGALLVSLVGYYMVLRPSAPLTVNIVIPQGVSIRKVADILKESQVIRSRNIFLAYMKLRESSSTIRAGTYVFSGRYTIPEVVQVLQSFRRDEVTVAIPEGSSIRAVGRIFEEKGIFSTERLVDVTGRPAEFTQDPSFNDRFEQEFPFLKGRPIGASLEGYLFPDTYNIYQDAPPEDVVRKMLGNFERRLKETGLLDEIRKGDRSLYEVITLASILEEEAVTEEDRKIVAGILENRLEKNIPLQVDATIMYVTGRGSSLLTASDLKSPSPYNTYVHKGLPAGPISSPGINAIRAVLEPTKTSYLYYLSDVNGTLHYARTFEEHKRNKEKYIP